MGIAPCSKGGRDLQQMRPGGDDRKPRYRAAMALSLDPAVGLEPPRGGFADPTDVARPGIDRMRDFVRGPLPPLGRLTGLHAVEVGVGSATIRVNRGVISSVMRLIEPPFPAATRHSKTTTTRVPLSATHCYIFTSSSRR